MFAKETWIIMVMGLVCTISACHYSGHSESGSDNSVDGTRRRRSTTTAGNKNITVVGYFPTCIEQRLNGTGSNSSTNNSTTRAWKGPVSYVVYHSRWYRRVNRTCWGVNDTVECWINNVVNVIRGQSRSLRAAQDCIVDYYKEYNGLDEYEVDEFPNGTDYTENSNCTTVSVTEYEQELIALINQSDIFDEEDVAFTQEYIDDLVDFAIEDLYCSDCTCANLAEIEDYFEEYEFEEGDCGECWYTTLATFSDSDSPVWDELSDLAYQIGEIKQVSACPRDPNVDFSPSNVVENILKINVTCGIKKIEIEMDSCGLVQLGYRKADEVYVADFSSSNYNPYSTPEECVARNKASEKITQISFEKSICGSVTSNATHEIHNFAVKNRRSKNDLYVNDGYVDRRVNIVLTFSCSYPLTSQPLTLPFGINGLQRTVSVLMTNHQQPLEVTMSAYKDENFTIPFLSNDTTILVPDPIWVRFTHNADYDVMIDVTSCSLDSEAIFEGTGGDIFIILDGCPFKEDNGTGSLDGVYQLKTCKRNEASFMFHSFIVGNSSIHIFCDFEVFDPQLPPCKDRNCQGIGSGTVRRKRNSNMARLDLILEPRLREYNISSNERIG